MNRTAATKLVATALAVASLGLASTAQADDTQGIAVGEPTPGQPLPAQTPDQATPPATQDDGAAAEEQAPPEKSQEQMDKERFDRFCNMKDAEPSHSDKKFCEDFRAKNPTTTTTTTGGRKCNEGGTRELCLENPDRPGYEKPGYERTDDYEETKPAAEKADKGSLPFTGLEIWQLGLLGIVLVGGGFGARRLLAS